MRASIVIAACNEGQAVVRTVESCLDACAGMGCEVIVADDASTDGSVAELSRRFPIVRVVRHERRLGASATKACGARAARGEVLVFLDGHTKPERGAIPSLVHDVERLADRAIVTPAIASLDTDRWRNDLGQIGHGYSFGLEELDCRWLTLEELVRSSGEPLYQSPALIGCAFAISRQLYGRLWGFDPHMRSWGVEDLDLGLKAWLSGAEVLHDPHAIIGHRFVSRFQNHSVAAEDVVANQLRLARKHFNDGVWERWVARARTRVASGSDGIPEGVWARAWVLFDADRASVEQERAYLMARRARDEFWYARRFGLGWSRIGQLNPRGAQPARVQSGHGGFLGVQIPQ